MSADDVACDESARLGVVDCSAADSARLPQPFEDGTVAAVQRGSEQRIFRFATSHGPLSQGCCGAGGVDATMWKKCCECKREVPLLVNLRALQKPESFALSSELVAGMGFDLSRGAEVRREELEAKGGPLRLFDP